MLKKGCLISVTVQGDKEVPIGLVGVYRGLENIGYNTYFTIELSDDEWDSVITMHPLDDVTRVTYYPQQEKGNDDNDAQDDGVPF